MTDPDFVRWPLPRDIEPGQSLTAVISFAAPGAAGDYQLKFDLVAEGVTWFEPGGTVVAIRPLRVGARLSG